MGKKVKPYKGLSGGEKARVDVCVLLALKDLSRSVGGKTVLNLSMFDEVFDSLDKTGVEDVCDLLEEQAQKEQIIVITHSKDVEDRFYTRLIVTKKDGISTAVLAKH